MHANIHGKNDQSGIPLQRLSYDRLEANGVYLIGRVVQEKHWE